MEDYFVLNLYTYIEKKGLSVRKFEEMSGVTQGIVSKAIKNKTSFSVATLQKIAIAFPDLDINWLIKEPPKPIKSSSTKAPQELEGFRS